VALRSRRTDALLVNRGASRSQLPSLPRYQECRQDHAGHGLLCLPPPGRRPSWCIRAELRTLPHDELVQADRQETIKPGRPGGRRHIESSESIWHAAGKDGDSPVESVRSDVVGDRGSRHAGHSPEPRAIRVDYVIQSFFDRISAHRHPCQRSLHLVPCQWALQEHADAMWRLPQLHDGSRRAAIAPEDNGSMRKLPPDFDVARHAVHGP